MKTIFQTLTICIILNSYALDNDSRVLTKEEIRYQKKIMLLDNQINTLNKQDEWQSFNKTYNVAERRKQINEINLIAETLITTESIAELTAMLVGSSNPQLIKTQQDIRRDGELFVDDIHVLILKDQYESKKTFLDQYASRPKKTSCCLIQ